MTGRKEELFFNIRLAAEVKKYPCIYDPNHSDYTRRDVTESAWGKVATALNDEGRNCKEKWRNLRTVFVRKLKPNVGRKNSKIYYMSRDMEFLLPFIKGPKNVDVPDNVPSPQSVQDDDCDYDYDDDDVVSEVDEKPLFFNDGTATTHGGLKLEKGSGHCATPAGYAATCADDLRVSCSSPKWKRTKQNDVPAAVAIADPSFVDYSNWKKPNSHNEVPHREEYRKHFLLSMLPEVNQMTDDQMRKFKRKMLDAIDDILGETSSS